MFVVIISPLVGNQSYSVAIKANVGNYPGIFCEISSVLHNIIMDVNIVVVLEFGFSSYHYIRNRHEYTVLHMFLMRATPLICTVM